MLYSLIETARVYDCEPYSYLRHNFTHLPKALSLADYKALLPWNHDRAKIILARLEGAMGLVAARRGNPVCKKRLSV